MESSVVAHLKGKYPAYDWRSEDTGRCAVEIICADGRRNAAVMHKADLTNANAEKLADGLMRWAETGKFNG